MVAIVTERTAGADYIDEPVLMVTVDGESETKHYYHQYSVVALTDASGSVVERCSYSAYGVPTFHDASTGAILSPQPLFGSRLGNPFLFTGRRYTAEDCIGNPALFIPGDFNGDGRVDQSDLDLVMMNWGSTDVPAGWLAVRNVSMGLRQLRYEISVAL